MSIRRLLPLLTASLLGAAVCYVLLTARPRTATAPGEPGMIVVSLPDDSLPSGRRTVRLTRIDPAGIPRDRAGFLVLPANCWVLSVGGASHYGTPE